MILGGQRDFALGGQTRAAFPTYADKGFLFLLVNMTDHDSPQIKVRTWQPNEVDMKKIYNAGYFYNE